MKALIKICFISILLTSLSNAVDELNHEVIQNKTGVESLSPKLRVLLIKEMLAIQEGMKAIFPAYISGDWRKIERIAEKIESSYILNQSLTDEQKKELNRSLSNSFKRLDEQFHYLAGMLKHVAKNEKAELVGFYYSKLGESCISCHTQNARHRFPAFEAKKPTHEQLH